MKKLFTIFLLFLFSFWNIFANINPKIAEINQKVYKNKILKEEKGEVYIKILDERISNFSEDDLKKYSYLIEKNIKNYSGKDFNLLKYAKFKIDLALFYWKNIGKKSEKNEKIENKSENNLKIIKVEEIWLEFLLETEKYFEILTKEDEKKFENQILNETNFYLTDKRKKDTRFYYFLKNKDIWFAIFPWKWWEFLNLDEMKKEFIRQDKLTENDLEEVTISWEKFYKYLQKFETENSKNTYWKELKVYNYFSFINEKPYYFTVLLDEKYKNEFEKVFKTIKIYEKSENKEISEKEFKNKDFKISYKDEKTITLKENNFWISLAKRWKDYVYSLKIIKKDLPKEFKNYDEFINFTKQRYNWKLEMGEKNLNSKKFLKIFLWEKQNFQKYNYLVNWKNNFYFEIEVSYLKGYENEVLEILKSFEVLK